ncbi:MAG: phosphatase PAP2 family protein [Oceanospirillales bacterium]|nr:phosphatase PAP2 family protein [Oceanospirillales bacterium]
MLKRRDIRFFILCVLIFTLWPSIDLWTSRLFYTPEEGFIYEDLPIFQLVYALFAKLHFVLLPLLIYQAVRLNRHRNSSPFQRRAALFLLLSLLLGPGILANVIIKDNSLGRARPSQIVEFGGQHDFAAAFEYSGACEKNCSFVSGHAAMGFWLISFAWVCASGRLFVAACTVGALVGLTRIVQGGHFLSDVVFAFWLIYFTNLLLGHWMMLRSPYATPKNALAGHWA